MAEWLIEEGIGETRAIRLEAGEIVEARLAWPDELSAGAVVDAQLVSRRRGQTRGIADLGRGTRALVDRLPLQSTEGSAIRLEITRPALREASRGKLAKARPTDAAPRPAPALSSMLEDEGHTPRIVHRFPEGDWDALMGEAFSREIGFAGGSLLISPTPAMTLIDIDGDLDPRSLALAACEPIATVLQRFDVGGSIGIDFPTLTEKAHRRQVDDRLAEALAGWSHERTAMNGFGFVQLVSRFGRVSILHRAAFQPAATAARLLLRRAETLHGSGIIELAGNPGLEAQLKPEWLAVLRRRTGCENRFRADSNLAVEAPHAQLVAR